MNLRLQTVSHGSLLTRLDFRTKLILLTVVTGVALLWESPRAQAVLALVVLAACLASGVRPAYVRTLVLVSLPFGIILLVIHGFWNVSQVKNLLHADALTPLVSFPPNWWLIGGSQCTLEGLAYGANVALKTLTILLVFPLVVFTSDVDSMLVAMVNARVPYNLAFVFSATLRFFPLLFAEANAILEAQRLRGLDLERMSPLRRLRLYGGIAVPLILGALVRSQQLEVVLQSKAFSGSSDRTYLHAARLRQVDFWVMGACGLFFAVVLAAYFASGVGRFGGPF